MGSYASEERPLRSESGFLKVFISTGVLPSQEVGGQELGNQGLNQARPYFSPWDQ